jgi:hypothetical protein
MARNRSTEFIDFVLNGNGYRFGRLRMHRDEVFSYDVKIGHVDRNAKRISYNFQHYSVTTSRHRNAILYAQNELMDNYGYTYCNDL